MKTLLLISLSLMAGSEFRAEEQGKPPAKQATLKTKARTLELDYKEKGPHGKPRRMRFLALGGGVVGVEITDGTGIGGGTLRLARGDWPPKIVLRLQLKGLEGSSVTIGKKVIKRDALNVRLCNPAGKPLEGKYRHNQPGYYEVTLPPAALKGANEVRISWVDFYRR